MRKLNLIDEDIVNSYLAGSSGYKVAKLFNTSQTQVRRILERNGVSGRYLRTPAEVENKIIEAYLGGESSEKIAEWCNLKPTTVCRIIKRNGHEIRSSEINHRKYKIKFDILDNIDTEEKAYFLGFMFADGNLSQSKCKFKIVLHRQDIDILHKFGKLLFDGPYPLYMDREYPLFTAVSKRIGKRLDELGCVPNKCFICKFPDYLTPELERHFIRGMFDGDGCIYRNKRRFLIDFTGNSFICGSIIDIIKRIGVNHIASYKRWPKADNNCVSFRINQRYEVYKFLNYIYKDSKIYLNRKYNKYLEFLDFYKENVIDYDKIIEMYNGGKNYNQISTELQMHSSTVWRILNRNT